MKTKTFGLSLKVTCEPKFDVNIENGFKVIDPLCADNEERIRFPAHRPEQQVSFSLQKYFFGEKTKKENKASNLLWVIKVWTIFLSETMLLTQNVFFLLMRFGPRGQRNVSYYKNTIFPNLHSAFKMV